ncbi:hypothetical protein DEIPH_ctg011orf0026 [Deinococcus phoenicis]|uniref:Phage head morphogenesis domain-containing protein n=1 Tax=Deinococcus phoenicis TaxID=1476583 RepID=A0A016QSK3_9DEIO|nr:phage minor head protein [Deinococcus phoenicis]EYB69060.1 hypothetical protein DEIPH_ctg011orf0026 [Deinococcus phoenicis]
MKQTPTLVQLLKLLEQDSRKLETQAVRTLLRAFKATDREAAALLRELVSLMLLQNPADRFAAKERLTRMAAALWPDLPPPLLLAVQDAVRLGGDVGAGMLAASGAPAALTIAAPAVEAAVGAIPARLTAIWGDARADHAARVGRVMTQALSAGGRYPVRAELQKALQVSRARAQMIAVTETQAALSDGQAQVFDRARDDLGLELEAEWLAARDSRTRPSHRRVDRERVPYGKKFSNGLTRPHMPGAPAAEVVRCRCSLAVRVKGGD